MSSTQNVLNQILNPTILVRFLISGNWSGPIPPPLPLICLWGWSSVCSLLSSGFDTTIFLKNTQCVHCTINQFVYVGKTDKVADNSKWIIICLCHSECAVWRRVVTGVREGAVMGRGSGRRSAGQRLDKWHRHEKGDKSITSFVFSASLCREGILTPVFLPDFRTISTPPAFLMHFIDFNNCGNSQTVHLSCNFSMH